MTHKYTERCIRKRRLYKGRAIDFCVDTVALSSGLQTQREYLSHPGAVAVVPLLDPVKHPDPRILLVRQYRYPVQNLTLEIPAGKLDEHERPGSCVRRELEEETGYKARRITPMISYWPTPAFATEILHIYLAQGLVGGRYNPDEDELIHPEILRLRPLLQMIRAGRIRDSKTIIGLLYFVQWRRRT
ncbi:MAG TPA: NUDIX hydrolase [Elusimicrobiota bacterium]|nr:NUDIX hydrolase [Elusimicrobiota bacterium]